VLSFKTTTVGIIGLGLSLSLYPAPLQADNVLSHRGACVASPELDERVRLLREVMGVVDLTVHPQDAPTGVNLGVIDASCLTGSRAPYREATIQRIHDAITRASEQMHRCYEHYRIVEGPDVGSILGRTRFLCQDPDGSDLIAEMRRTSRTYDSCGRVLTRFTDGAYRRYQMTLSAPSSDLPAATNKSASTMLSVEELASYMAHEAMHVLAMNNRDWHNTFDPDERVTEGCTRSLFEDRVYFTQAMCFPQSEYGRSLYGEGGASQCREVCIRALTEVDAGAALTFSTSTAPGSERTGAFGPSQVARPYPAGEASRICDRVAMDRGRSL